MKYWNIHNNQIQMKADDNFNNGRILNIININNNYIFEEGCDNQFALELSKEQAIELLQEAIDFIKGE